jgi:cytochrome b561
MMILFRNTTSRFGIIAILLHWTMAILIIGLLALGLYMTRIPVSLHKLEYFGWHKEFGLLALLLVIVRLTWRLTNTLPSLASIPPLEEFAARATHWAFYVFMFALPITGWMLTSAAGLPVSFFGWFVLPNLVDANESTFLTLTQIHAWLGYGLIATFCLHTAGALKHHFINKDEILKRMLKP